MLLTVPALSLAVPGARSGGSAVLRTDAERAAAGLCLWHSPATTEPSHTTSSEAAGHQAFSSFFSSFRNRQSVPWAMIFCGVALIMPTSCSRSA
jgi:hypothetical protein